MHKVDADVVHIQLAHCCQPHIGISHHTAGYDARLLHDTVAGHTEFLHIGQGCAILKVGAGNGADPGHFAAQHLPPGSGKDVGGRHIDTALGVGQHGLLKIDKLVHRSHNGIFTGPLTVAVKILVIRIGQYQRLMVVTVEAHFPALLQQQAAIVSELLSVRLTDRRALGIVLIVFDHDTGKTDRVLLCKLYEIRPPDLGIEVRYAHSVIPADISTIAAGHRRGKIVQIEHRTVDDGVSSGIAQQAEGRCIDAAHDFVVDADVVHHHPAGTGLCAPYQRNAFVPCAGIDCGFLPEADAERGFKWVTELIPLPAAQHKLLCGNDAFGDFVLPRRGQNAKFWRYCIKIRRFLGCHGKQDAAAVPHPVHQVEQAFA